MKGHMKMTKIDIVSGFLGAGKTTLIKKLLKEAMINEKVVLIENEFGEIGIDGGFLKDAGVEIKEMNSGCICCSLVGDFGTSLQEVLTTYQPERILIEPSGVGKLSDVIKAVEGIKTDVEVRMNTAIAVVDAGKCKMYIKNFGEFFINQIEYAQTIILSRTAKMPEDKLQKVIEMIREHNSHAKIITTPWELLDGKLIMDAIEGAHNFEKELLEETANSKEEHHHDHHDHEEHEHHHDHEEHEHHHDHEEHEHHHDHEEHEHNDHEEHEHHHHEEHEHHHDHGDGCTCGCHDDDHHEHHHADEVFTSWGMESPVIYNKAEIVARLEALEDDTTYGLVLRAKGMVPGDDGTWIYFDYVPGELEVREGTPDYTGKICVIGSMLIEKNLDALFKK